MPEAHNGGCLQTVSVTLETLARLAILAFIDSTSIGTLVIPVWPLLRPDPKGHVVVAGKAAAYLSIIGVFYFLVGLGLLSGAIGASGLLGTDIAAVLGLPAVQWAMLLGGGAMLAWSLLAGKSSGVHLRDAARPAALETRWQQRIGRALNTRGGLLGLAFVAGLLELPTMLPYLGAVGLLTASGTGWALSAALLAAYCLVMLLPAGLLVSGRLVLGRFLDAPLARLGAWLSKAAGEAMLWVAGIVGFLLLRAALAGLFPGQAWNPFG